MRWMLIALLMLSPAAFAAEIMFDGCYDFERDAQGDVTGAVAVSCESSPPPPPPPPQGGQLALPSSGLYPLCDDASQSVSWSSFVAPHQGGDRHQLPGTSLDINGDGAFDVYDSDYCGVTTAAGYGQWTHLLDVAQSQCWVANTYSGIEELNADGATIWLHENATISGTLRLRPGSRAIFVGGTVTADVIPLGGVALFQSAGINGGNACVAQ